MNQQQKEILRDCFEGCMPFEYAVQIIEAGDKAASDAMATWARWTVEMEEEGYYIY